MGIALPSEILSSLEVTCPCRSAQLRQLTALYSDLYPSPRNLVVYGLQGTGRLHTVCAVLSARKINHAVVRSRECLSLRHLLSKIHTACIDAVYHGGDKGAEDAYERRTESVNALCVSLQRLLQGRDDKLVVVLEGIDHQRGLSPNTLPALARLTEIVPKLCLIFVVTTPRPLHLQKAGIPYLHFPPYARAEAISLVVRSPPPLASQAYLEANQDHPTLQKWYALFATTVYESLVAPTSLYQSHFEQTCSTLWPRFIWPYLSGERPPGKGKNAQWDFPKLLVRQRSLFQAAGEETLAARLLPNVNVTTFDALQRKQEESKNNALNIPSSTALPRPNPLPTIQSPPSNAPLLALFPTILLSAAYLASHTPPKLDILLFSRLSSSSRSARVKKSYHRRKLFQSPSKHKSGVEGPGTAGEGASGAGTPKKRARSGAGRAGLEMNLNLARPFTLERLVALFRAIHPRGVHGKRSVTDRVGREIAELERLRLIVPAAEGGAGAGSGGGVGTRALVGDEAGAEEKRWRVNVPRAFVEELAAHYESEVQGVGGLVREFELLDA
ncbi:hypothetical protein EPUS_04465 [Endocarpon pusillum Z07020]|uniref:Orc1-like AAA ATPase domain-containing protein n=1 Tax=Endocarpon pusillum (strain Z07020 / HMAS-L-300199) TaxID=1263415 RepID=U1I0D4_ENDPU|nr:uncharacterized protein EPUS_04465 [Endocarpon pusillum Z07020]ERF76645.1 hypothetical protein EPUS_04465 [Endocarpon pusillum Z07020]